MRLSKLDTLRGLNLISMMAYHAMWDVVYLFGRDMAWYKGTPGFIWQQLICQTFILLSGFSWNLGKHHIKRGLTVFLAGALVTLVTLIFMPEAVVIFGILTFMGSAMLIMVPFDRLFRRFSGRPANALFLILSLVLFIVTRYAGRYITGTNYFTAYLGFPFPGFFSDDYFPLIPWFFLYMTGYFLYRVLPKEKIGPVLTKGFCPPLEFIGRHTLIIYLMHQPVILGVLMLIFRSR